MSAYSSFVDGNGAYPEGGMFPLAVSAISIQSQVHGLSLRKEKDGKGWRMEGA